MLQRRPRLLFARHSSPTKLHALQKFNAAFFAAVVVTLVVAVVVRFPCAHFLPDYVVHFIGFPLSWPHATVACQYEVQGATRFSTKIQFKAEWQNVLLSVRKREREHYGEQRGKNPWQKMK